VNQSLLYTLAMHLFFVITKRIIIYKCWNRAKLKRISTFSRTLYAFCIRILYGYDAYEGNVLYFNIKLYFALLQMNEAFPFSNVISADESFIVLSSVNDT
jgi:hypothetical protein